MSRQKPSRARSLSRGAFLFALAYWGCAALSLRLTQGTDGIATLWPGSGILLAALILLPRGSAIWIIGLTGMASLIANIGAGASPALACAFTVANLVEATTGAVLWRRLGGGRTLFLGWRDVARFCAASVGAALCSATTAWLLSGMPGGLFASSWFATVLLGLLIVTPALMVAAELRHPDATATMSLPSRTTIATMLLGVALVAGLAFWQSSYPLLFVPLIALLAVTHRLGVFGASMGVLVIAVVASGLSFAGHGPVMLMHASIVTKSFFLQIYLLALFATSLPLAALLASRERLAGQCRRSERMHRLLAEASNDIVVRFALDGTPLYVSPACHAILGYSPKELMVRGAVRDVHPADRAQVLETWAGVLRGEELETCLYRQRRSDGREVWLEAAYRLADADATGGDPEVVATVRDVTRRRLAELATTEAAESLGQANEMLADAEAVARLGHWRVDLRTNAIIWSAGVARIHDPSGRPPENVEEALALYHAADRERVRKIIRAAIDEGDAFTFEARLVTGSGEIRHVVSKGSIKRDADGVPIGLFGTLQDVTEWVRIEHELDAARRAAEAAAERALHLADTDALTGVASRRRAMNVLAEAFAAAKRGARSLSVVVLDIDHFKRVNDQHGHAVGDAVLVHVAQAVAANLRTGDVIGRLGGEEFVIIAAGANGREALAMADRIRGSVRSAFDGALHLPPVTVSMGVAVLEQENTPTDLLDAADRALYAAKNSGRNMSKLAA